MNGRGDGKNSAQGRGGWIGWDVVDELFASLGRGAFARCGAFGAMPASGSWIWLRHPRTVAWRLVCGLGERVLRLVLGFWGAGWVLGCGWF